VPKNIPLKFHVCIWVEVFLDGSCQLFECTFSIGWRDVISWKQIDDVIQIRTTEREEHGLFLFIFRDFVGFEVSL
jgi:hypothetical protein